MNLTKHTGRPWEPLPVDAELAGLTVLKLKTRASTQDDTIYRVRYDCCRETDDMSHALIVRRAKGNNCLCAKCSRGGKEPPRRKVLHQIPPPMWPVPPTVRNQ